MGKATTLVIISGQEDISMAEDSPSKLALYASQASLIDKVRMSGDKSHVGIAGVILHSHIHL